MSATSKSRPRRVENRRPALASHVRESRLGNRRGSSLIWTLSSKLRRDDLTGSTEMTSDIEQLTALNGEYINSDQFRDVDRYQEILAPDYRATLPDLIFRNKDEFLAMLRDAPRPFTDLTAHDLEIRVFNDFALIHGRVTFNDL